MEIGHESGPEAEAPSQPQPSAWWSQGRVPHPCEGLAWGQMALAGSCPLCLWSLSVIDSVPFPCRPP